MVDFPWLWMITGGTNHWPALTNRLSPWPSDIEGKEAPFLVRRHGWTPSLESHLAPAISRVSGWWEYVVEHQPLGCQATIIQSMKLSFYRTLRNLSSRRENLQETIDVPAKYAKVPCKAYNLYWVEWGCTTPRPWFWLYFLGHEMLAASNIFWDNFPCGNWSYENLGKCILSNPPNCPTPFDVFGNFTNQESIPRVYFERNTQSKNTKYPWKIPHPPLCILLFIFIA